MNRKIQSNRELGFQTHSDTPSGMNNNSQIGWRSVMVGRDGFALRASLKFQLLPKFLKNSGVWHCSICEPILHFQELFAPLANSVFYGLRRHR